jgi:ribosomal protein L10
VAYVSIGGNKYGFVIVDDYSRYTWVFFMKDKSKVHEIFKKFATRAQNEFDVKIKRGEVKMAPSSRTPTLKSILMKKALVMNSPSHTLHNKMG